MCGVAGVLGLAKGLPLRDFVDAALLLMGRSGPPNFKQLVTKVERELEVGIVAELGGYDAVAEDCAMAEGLLAAHGRNLRECVELGLKPGAIVKDGTRHQGDTTPACRLIIERVYAAILEDPAQVELLLPDALRALLALRERIEKLPEPTAEALIDWQTRLILSDGRRMLAGPIALDSMLLRADYGVVPFHPQRAAEIGELVAWCERDARVSVRLLHGPGGTGKSRLLVEVTDRLRRRGWQAGFLEPDADQAPAGTFARLLAGEQPVCVTATPAS